MTARGDLGTLEASGLIQLASVQPELEYLFRHALVQDAAYSSLLKQDRRALHQRAGETLLTLYPERQRELAGVIAMHFEQAGDAARAAEHFVVAGEHAAERYANREAVAFFDRADALRPADAPPESALRTAIGAIKAGLSFGVRDMLLDKLQRAIAPARESRDQRLLADGYFWVAFLRSLRGEVVDTSPELRAALENAERIGEALGDPNLRAVQNSFVGGMMLFAGRLRAGAQMLDQALQQLEDKADPLSTAILSDFVTMAYARLGEFDLAERAIARSERLAATGDPIARLDAMIGRSTIHLERGEFAESAAVASRCTATAEELGATACLVVSDLMVGAARLALEDVPGAKAPAERSYELSIVTNQLPCRALAQGMLGSIQTQLGDREAGTAGWEQSLAFARASGDRFGEASTLWLRARTRARETPPDWAAAIHDLDAAIALFEMMEARPSLSRALRDRAQALRALERNGEADAAARRSEELAQELGLKDFG
jgi:tetratricopeptide (TPR) repeat protein